MAARALAKLNAKRSFCTWRFHEGQVVPGHIAIIMDGNGRWATSATCRARWASRWC